MQSLHIILAKRNGITRKSCNSRFYGRPGSPESNIVQSKVVPGTTRRIVGHPDNYRRYADGSIEIESILLPLSTITHQRYVSRTIGLQYRSIRFFDPKSDIGAYLADDDPHIHDPGGKLVRRSPAKTIDPLYIKITGIIAGVDQHKIPDGIAGMVLRHGYPGPKPTPTG